MKIRLIRLVDEIKSSYWFVPALMAASAIALSFITIAFDNYFQAEVLRSLGFIWSGGADGARGLLETVAGSMITVAGVTFSITMVALSLASTQFGSRLLRNFMADPANQIVLGTFISTFIFCLLILRTIRSGDDEFVPYISVTIGLVLALTSLAVLIYFIHHVALSMQAPYLIAEVAGDLFKTIDRLLPAEVGLSAPEDKERRDEEDVPEDFQERAEPLKAETNGYIQAIDQDALLALASKHDLIINMPYRPGHFLTEEDAMAEIWPGDKLDKDLANQIQKTFIIGKQRTHTQDVEFGIQQLVEVADRSLSSGINDPLTAITCIDWLGAALARLSKKDFPSPYRYDEHGALRMVWERPLTLSGAIDTALNQIRQSASTTVAVRIRLLEKIAMLQDIIDDPQALASLERQAEMVAEGDKNDRPVAQDQKDIRERYREVKKKSNQS